MLYLVPFSISLSPEPSWPSGGMSRPKWGHHTVPNQLPVSVCCGYWECEHYQLHSWEVQPHLWATLKSSLRLWQCVSSCCECGGSGSCKNVYNTNHQWVNMHFPLLTGLHNGEIHVIHLEPKVHDKEIKMFQIFLYSEVVLKVTITSPFEMLRSCLFN